MTNRTKVASALRTEAAALFEVSRALGWACSEIMLEADAIEFADGADLATIDKIGRFVGVEMGDRLASLRKVRAMIESVKPKSVG